MNVPAKTSYFYAAVAGLSHGAFLMVFWGFFAMWNPINRYLIDVFAAEGRTVEYYSAIYTHDLGLNILLSVPFAFFAWKMIPQHRFRAFVAALSASLLISYWYVLLRPPNLEFLLGMWGFWAGLATHVASFGAAFAIVTGAKWRANAT